MIFFEKDYDEDWLQQGNKSTPVAVRLDYRFSNPTR